MSSSLVVVLELRKLAAAVALRPPCVCNCDSSGGATPVTPDGQPVPDGVQPLTRFCCMTRNEGMILSGLTWLISYAMNRCSPRRPIYDACPTNPHGNSRCTLKFHS